MQIKPQFTNLLIHLRDMHVSPAGLSLPETLAPQEPYGMVLDVGADCKTIKPGDRVLFLPNAVIGFGKEAEQIFLIAEGCVLATLIDDEPSTNPITLN